MRFIKENPALAAGIGLPFLLVIFFSFSAAVTQWTVEPPKYDVFFTVQSSQCIAGDAKANFSFASGKIKAKYIYQKKENNYVNCYDNQRIYRFNAKNLVSKEITFEVPAKNEDSQEWKEFDVAELKDLKIDNSPVALDGYSFKKSDAYYRGGFFPFFGGYNYRDGMVISKNGRTIRILPVDEGSYYSYNNINFLGWVVSEGEQK